LIDNIQLSKYDECATFSIVKYWKRVLKWFLFTLLSF
jgi:hypothetical protein